MNTRASSCTDTDQRNTDHLNEMLDDIRACFTMAKEYCPQELYGLLGSPIDRVDWPAQRDGVI